MREARFRCHVFLCSHGHHGSRRCHCRCPCPPRHHRHRSKRSAHARARATQLRTVPSSDRKAGSVIVVADTNSAAPALLLLPFAFAVVPMDGLGQFNAHVFWPDSIVIVDCRCCPQQQCGCWTMMTTTASKTRRRRCVLPGMLPTTIVTRLNLGLHCSSRALPGS